MDRRTTLPERRKVFFRTLPLIAAFAAGATLTLLVRTWRAKPTPSVLPAREIAEAPGTDPVVMDQFGRRELARAVREAVRDELHGAYDLSLDRRPDAAATEEKPVEKLEVNVTDVRAARTVLDDALSKGSWSRDDGERLRVIFQRLPDEERVKVRLDLARAINTDMIKVDAHPFLP